MNTLKLEDMQPEMVAQHITTQELDESCIMAKAAMFKWINIGKDANPFAQKKEHWGWKELEEETLAKFTL